MSLQIWLPLNGNLRNRGCNSSLTIASVQTGCSVSTDGKLGSCYKNTGTNNAVAIPITFSSNQFSMCAWLRIDTLRNNWVRAFGMTGTGTYAGFGCEHSNGSSLGFHFYKTIGGTNTNIFDKYPVSSEVGKWVHYCMVYNGSDYFIYKNGSQVSTGSVGVANTPVEMNTLLLFGGNPNYYSYHSLNDVRIYDHALSVAEVKELAKGLVCHYKLDDYKGLPNLVSNSKTFSGWSAASGWTQVATDNGSVGYRFTRTGATSNNWVRLIPTLKVNGNDYPNGITVSLDLLTPSKADINQKCIGSINTYQESGSRIGWDEPGWNLTNVIDGKWSRVSYTFSKTQLLVNRTSGTTYSYTQFSFQLVQNGDITIRNIKIENGNVSTLYIPNSSDAEYKVLGYDSTTIIDCSGNGYNGTKSGTLTPSTDTPRYTLSTNFPENSSTVTITPYLTNNQTLTEISVSCWYKTNTLNSTAPNLWSLGENLFLRLRLASTTSIWYYARVGSTQTGYTYAAGKTLTDNAWHHVVLTFKNGVFVVYVDGSQIGTSDASGTSTYLTCANTAWHLAGYTANSENFIGNLSDFRIYTTCLSADDVKRLYNTAASVSRIGQFFGCEFNEVME